MGYGHVLIYVVACHITVLKCTSLYVLHTVWCLISPVLLQQVQQCRTQAQQCCGYGVVVPHLVVTAILLCMNCHLHHVYLSVIVCSTLQERECRWSPITFTKI